MAAHSQDAPSDVETLPFVVGMVDVGLSQSLASTPGAGTFTNESIAKEVSSRGKALTREMAQGGLSRLGCTPDSVKLVYLDLHLSGSNLSDISILTSFPHLQSLDLSHNALKDLSPLSSLPNLSSLNASHNKLTALLDFDPPRSLMFVNYSHNEIEEIPELVSFNSIKVLNVDGNQITELTGLSSLSSLTTLTVSDNRIERIQGLDDLPIEHLSLSSNSISSVTNLDSLKLLQEVNLSSNQIHSLRGLSHHTYLSDIDMSDNQIIDLHEILHLKELKSLKTLDLRKNPLQTLPDYRLTVITQLATLSGLDGQLLTVEEKVAANNRESSPPEVIAGHHHLQLVCKGARKAARLNFSTLTHIDEPYPMLVLCGPPGSAKGMYSQSLVEEFPSFFGLGVSHTTRPQGSRESHGRDYYFINEVTFDRALETGEFIQVAKVGGYRYGLTMAAIEQVAQQGLACVTHVTLEGVLALKRSHFEPRYILTLPLNSHVHEQRLRSKAHLDEDDVQQSLNDVKLYEQFHQERAGFFDATINTDNLQEGYNTLQNIVMAYGDISPETPLTLSLSASRPTTQHTSTTFSLSDIPTHDGVFTQHPLIVPPSTSAPATAAAVLPRPWSRPSSSGSVGLAPPLFSSSGHHSKLKKSVSDQGTDSKLKHSFQSSGVNMLGFINRIIEWFKSLFWKEEMELTLVGLQNSGKTTFVNVIASGQFNEDMIPTVGFNMRKVTKGNVTIKLWDIGGQPRFRSMWERYCRGVTAIIYMIDAADHEKIEPSKNELHNLLDKPQLSGIPVLVLGNKVDLPNALREREIIEKMGLSDIKDREICCYSISCKERENIDITLQWLIQQAKKP